MFPFASVANHNLIHAKGGECQDDLADIVFLLDASRSVTLQNFRTALEFVKRVVEQLEIGPNDVQIGVLTFADKVSPQFYLNKYSDKEVSLWLQY